jgi:hypothetical protein
MVRPPSQLSIREWTRAPIAHELVDELGLDSLRIDVGCLTPCNKQIITVCDLPQVATAPVADGLTCAVSAELVEAFRQPATACGSRRRLSDVEDRRTIHPGSAKRRHIHRRVLALEPTSGARVEKRRFISALAHDHVHTSTARYVACWEVVEPDEAFEPRFP